MRSVDLPKQMYVIEGNVGAGKSTFLSLVEKYLAIDPIFEPHEQWQAVGEEGNLLHKFYNDTHRWAYTFQTYAFVTRVLTQEDHLKTSNANRFMLERSVFSDRYCFAKNSYELGFMSGLEWQIYCDWFSWLVDRYTTMPSGFIYMRTDPVISYERIKQRGRAEEAGTSLDYFKRLHEKHEEWLINKVDIPDRLSQIPVLVLQCDKDFEHDVQEQQRHMQDISTFFGVSFKEKSGESALLNL